MSNDFSWRLRQEYSLYEQGALKQNGCAKCVTSVSALGLRVPSDGIAPPAPHPSTLIFLTAKTLRAQNAA